MSCQRTDLHHQVIEALIETKAIDFDALGGVLAKFGARAAISGSSLGAIINKRVIDVCIPPEPYINIIDLKSLAGKVQE
jgi:hypothetical protein